MVNGLDNYFIEGVKTNKDFVSNIIQKPEFLNGDYSTSFIAENYDKGFDPYMTDLKDKTKLS